MNLLVPFTVTLSCESFSAFRTQEWPLPFMSPHVAPHIDTSCELRWAYRTGEWCLFGDLLSRKRKRLFRIAYFFMKGSHVFLQILACHKSKVSITAIWNLADVRPFVPLYMLVARIFVDKPFVKVVTGQSWTFEQLSTIILFEFIALSMCLEYAATPFQSASQRL